MEERNSAQGAAGEPKCGQCGRRVFRTPTNRCMYCGKPLPDQYRFSPGEMEAFRQRPFTGGEEGESFASGMRSADALIKSMSSRKKKPRRRKGLFSRMGAFLLGLFNRDS
jgi:ribosomal protein L37E